MKNQAANVRRAGPEDVGVLAPVFEAYRQFYGQTPAPEAARAFLEARLRQQESTVFIAEDTHGEVGGFVQLFPLFSSVSLAASFVLNDLFVSASFRRRGVARALLRAAVDFCRDAGAVRVSLSTAVTNEPAQSLYEACGWARQKDYHVYFQKL
jgi:ribosomal protein S18 acetylase RimI-like enzyme